MFFHESDILRKLRLIGWLKAELVTNIGQLYQAMAKNSEQAISASCYVLGRWIILNFIALDKAVLDRLQKIKQKYEVELWFGDLSECQRCLRQRR